MYRRSNESHTLALVLLTSQQHQNFKIDVFPSLLFHIIAYARKDIAHFIQSIMEISAHFHTIYLCLAFGPKKHIFSISVFIFMFCFCFMHIFMCLCPTPLWPLSESVSVYACFISCLCFNSNPSSRHAFPAVDLKMVYEYDKLSMWSSILLLLAYRSTYLENLPLFFLSTVFVHLKALQWMRML